MVALGSDWVHALRWRGVGGGGGGMCGGGGPADVLQGPVVVDWGGVWAMGQGGLGGGGVIEGGVGGHGLRVVAVCEGH